MFSRARTDDGDSTVSVGDGETALLDTETARRRETAVPPPAGWLETMETVVSDFPVIDISALGERWAAVVQ